MHTETLLVVVMGRAGTGKTTLARLLAERIGGAYIRIDVIVGPMLRAGVVSEEQGADLGYAIAGEVAYENLDAGVSVVVDGLNATNSRRRGWSEIARSAEVRVVYLETFLSDIEEHRRRVEGRSSGLSGYLGPSWEDIQTMAYEPSAAVGIDTFHTETALADALAHLQ